MFVTFVRCTLLGRIAVGLLRT